MRSFPLIALILMNLIAAAASQSRPRARDLGIAPGVMDPGAHNAITDVGGVRVGHTTIVNGDDVRTGVTAILPARRQPLPAEGRRCRLRR